MEDDDALRELYCLWLEAAGYHVIVQANSKGVMKLIEKHAPALVITEMIMPDFDGAEAIFHIIDQHSTPIIAISYYPHYLELVEKLVTGCLLKPLIAATFIDLIDLILDKTPHPSCSA